jgi:protein involved in polysaccharide export with SLBB domain
VVVTNPPPTPAEAGAQTLLQKTTQILTQGLADAYADNRGNVLLVAPPRDLAAGNFSRALPLDWTALQASAGARGDVVLRDGDVIYVPVRPALILVAGAVQNQGAQRYEPRLTIGEALQRAGGPGPDAEVGRLVVVRFNGEITAAVKLTTVLEPGDAVVVPSTYIIKNVHSQSGLERIMSFLAATVAGFRFLF